MINDAARPQHAFPTTRHSLVIQSRTLDSTVRARALEALLAAYWKPVFVANELKAALRLKRGGDAQKVSLSLESAEEELRQHRMAQGLDMEAYFHREWVRSLFDVAVEAFRADGAGGL